jgi:hypothetical protein
MRESTAARLPDLLSVVCREMDEMAREEEESAAREAAATPYWMPCSQVAAAHRRAARVLRARARRLERESRALAAWAATASP